MIAAALKPLRGALHCTQRLREAQEDIAGLQRETRERDELLLDKDQRIAEGKAAMGEMQKLKFVLEYKVDELRGQVVPREQKLSALAAQISVRILPVPVALRLGSQCPTNGKLAPTGGGLPGLDDDQACQEAACQGLTIMKHAKTEGQVIWPGQHCLSASAQMGCEHG